MLRPPIITVVGIVSVDEHGAVLVGDEPLGELVARLVGLGHGESSAVAYVVTIAATDDD